MGRHSACCVKQKLRKGLWSPEEDEKLLKYITRFGVGCWSSVPKHAGLQRCGKSCRLRWINYLRPDLKRGLFSQQEEDIILNLHQVLGNRWAQIAAQLPGRTDNEIKNFWNSCLKKKLMKQGIDPNTHKPVNNDHNKIELFASSSMPMASELASHAFHFNNGGLMLSSSMETGLIRESKSICDPLFLVEFQSSVDPIGYNSNLLAQFHQTNYETTSSLPNLASFDHPNGYFSDHSSSKMSSSTTNSSNINSSLSAGFQPAMTFEGDQFNVKSEAKCVGQWAHDDMHEVQLNNASGFNISVPAGDYTHVFHKI